MLRPSLWFAAVSLALVVLIAGACGQTEGQEIADIKWTLNSYGEPDNLNVVIEGSEITATFEKSPRRVRGSAGCNTYFAECRIDDNELNITQIGYTEMACLNPGIMEQEQQYLEILSRAESYQVTDDTLQINCSGEILVYTTAQD